MSLRYEPEDSMSLHVSRIDMLEAKLIRQQNRIDLLQRQNQIWRNLVLDIRQELSLTLKHPYENGSERAYFRDKIKEALEEIEAMEKEKE